MHATFRGKTAPMFRIAGVCALLLVLFSAPAAAQESDPYVAPPPVIPAGPEAPAQGLAPEALAPEVAPAVQGRVITPQEGPIVPEVAAAEVRRGQPAGLVVTGSDIVGLTVIAAGLLAAGTLLTFRARRARA